MQVSALRRYYSISGDELRRMDEIQVQNRMSDLKRLFDMERRRIGLAVWGAAKDKGDDDGRRGGSRRDRRGR